jgi:Zn-dependent peptidase ImmA (M78 family)
VENREPTGAERVEERQANQFAARLLAPACVLHEIGALTPEEIQRVCGISHQAAAFRAQRMLELESRGKFYAHPLEKEVLTQFSSYIAAELRR